MPTVSGIVVATGGSPATGRRSFLDVINEIARPVDASDTTIRALAADAFRAAVRTMNRKGLWPWEVLDEDISMTANQPFSSISSAVKKPLAMHYLTAAGGTRDQRIGYLPYDEFIETFNHNLTGTSFRYTFPNLFETGQIRWGPIPRDDDNLRLTYYRVTPAPRSEQETVEIPDHAIEPYMAYAWYEFLKRLPTEQRPFDIGTAQIEARLAFREISTHVNTPGDRSREVSSYG